VVVGGNAVVAAGSLFSLWRVLVFAACGSGHELWRQDKAWTFNQVDHT